MEVLIESTPIMVEYSGGVCRVFEGVTGAGVKVKVLVRLIAPADPKDQDWLCQEMAELLPTPQMKQVREVIR